MKCFYHNDMDGHCAGFIVKLYLDYFAYIHDDVENYFDKTDFIESDYNLNPIDPDIVGNEDVYVVDYSFSENTKHILDSLISKCRNLIWIDHHDSSLELCRNHPEYKDIAGIRSKDGSGAWLTYKYLLVNKGYDIGIPDYIKLVSDYDTWNLYDDCKYFKLGMDSVPNDVFDEIWEKLDNEYDSYDDSDTIANLIRSGKYIKSYIDMDNKNYLESYGYPSTTPDGLHSVYVVNKKTNSWIFGNKINEYDACVVFAFDGSKYSYSIYSSNESYFDCQEFAKMYGGGGHMNSAGFVSEDLLFRRNV